MLYYFKLTYIHLRAASTAFKCKQKQMHVLYCEYLELRTIPSENIVFMQDLFLQVVLQIEVLCRAHVIQRTFQSILWYHKVLFHEYLQW